MLCEHDFPFNSEVLLHLLCSLIWEQHRHSSHSDLELNLFLCWLPINLSYLIFTFLGKWTDHICWFLDLSAKRPKASMFYFLPDKSFKECLSPNIIIFPLKIILSKSGMCWFCQTSLFRPFWQFALPWNFQDWSCIEIGTSVTCSTCVV